MLNLIPATINFTREDGLAIYRGSDWIVYINVADKEACEFSPIDITGFTGKGSLKVSAEDDVSVMDITVKVEDGLQGLFSLSIDSVDTLKIPAEGSNHNKVTKYQYDVYLEKGEEVYRVLQGFVEVSPNITEE